VSTFTNFSGKNTAKQYKLNTLLKQSRESTILGKTHRAKYIVDPTKIDTVGIHNIWKFRSGNAAHFVDPEFARININKTIKKKKFDFYNKKKFSEEQSN
jgi:hypothetical protein